MSRGGLSVVIFIKKMKLNESAGRCVFFMPACPFPFSIFNKNKACWRQQQFFLLLANKPYFIEDWDGKRRVRSV